MPSCSEQYDLRSACFGVLGAGGLANQLVPHLLDFGARRFLLVDFDVVDETNLHRQFFFTESNIGQLKAEVMAQAIRAQFPDATVEARNVRLQSAAQIMELIAECNFVIRSADSPREIDSLINEACLITKIPFVIAGTATQRGIVGPLVVPFRTACASCWNDEVSRLINGSKERRVLFYNRTTPVLGPMVGLVSELAAYEIASFFLSPEQCRLTQGFYMIDFINLDVLFLPTKRNADACPSCGTGVNLSYDAFPKSNVRSHAATNN
jgi:sulfur-carrier protein adenylyltransferase/sulfurtransferase